MNPFSDRKEAAEAAISFTDLVCMEKSEFLKKYKMIPEEKYQSIRDSAINMVYLFTKGRRLAEERAEEAYHERRHGVEE